MNDPIYLETTPDAEFSDIDKQPSGRANAQQIRAVVVDPATRRNSHARGSIGRPGPEEVGVRVTAISLPRRDAGGR